MPDQPTVRVGYFAVCILDLLGQKAELAGWSKLRPEGGLTPEMLSSIQKTAGRVSLFKRNFINLFTQFDTCHLTSSHEQLIEAKRPGLYRRFKAWPLRTQQFSDTFVFYCPMTNESGDISVQPIYRMLAACAIAMFGSLADKAPLRGGLCVGTGMELEDGNFYGPALAAAHFLESKVAKYPRIVVADEVLQFVNQQSGFSDDPDIDSILGVMAQTCRLMLCTDEDSKTIVDFLGPAMKQFSQTSVEDAVRSAREFAQSEAARFAGKVGDQERDLADRYRRLQRYIEARLTLWNV